MQTLDVCKLVDPCNKSLSYLHLVRKKGQLISEHIKGPLVALFRSPKIKVLDSSVEKFGSMNCNFSVTFIKSLNQSSIKPCLIAI